MREREKERVCDGMVNDLSVILRSGCGQLVSRQV